MSKHPLLYAIPTNLITGFLGVGKTTAILALLAQKPTDERWAVLVNEFGEVGIDGDFYAGHNADENSVFIREVPGGCMCCAAGLPMHIALNQLLAQAKPHRLLIEPTGLGHPKEVLEVLTAEHYQEVLDIQRTITLVDARKLHDTKYTSHDGFNQHIDMADVVVANKVDLYEEGDKALLEHYIAARRTPVPKVVFAQQGVIDPSLLHGASSVALHLAHHHHAHQHTAEPQVEPKLPSDGLVTVTNQSEDAQSIGWRIAPNKIFNRSKLVNWLKSLDVMRAKAVMITHQGIFGYNLTDNALQETEFDDCAESRMEIIADHVDDAWAQQLMDCLEDQTPS